MKTKRTTSTKVSKTRKPISKKRNVKEKPKKIARESALNSQVEKNWQAQFILAEHWRSDVDFFGDELKFFQRLMDKYFVWISEDRLMENAKKITVELVRMNKRRANFGKQITEHLRHLTNLIQNPFAHDAQECEREHEALELTIVQIMKDFRAVKKEVFQLVEILETEQARPLLEAQ